MSLSTPSMTYWPDLMTHLGVTQHKPADGEADDAIATRVCVLEGEGLSSVLVSSDKDMYQCISRNVRIHRPTKDGPELWDVKKYATEYGGLTPDYVPDYKAFVGDSSDNLPGCKGIGHVGALKLLTEGNVRRRADVVIANAEGGTYKPSLTKKIIDAREDIILTRRLATLDDNADLRTWEGAVDTY